MVILKSIGVLKPVVSTWRLVGTLMNRMICAIMMTTRMKILVLLEDLCLFARCSDSYLLLARRVMEMCSSDINRLERQTIAGTLVGQAMLRLPKDTM